MSRQISKRQFLGQSACVTGLLASEQSVFKSFDQACAADIKDKAWWQDLTVEDLAKRIQSTPRESCVEFMIGQLNRGLSYQTFLSALFLEASKTHDLHQMAQVYAAHRVSIHMSKGEQWLPLFWALDRIKQGQEHMGDTKTASRGNQVFTGLDQARTAFKEAMESDDKERAEHAAIALSRLQGPRRTMQQLWKYSGQNLAGTLGHFPIGVANATRMLDFIGWHHAEPALRYLAGEMGRFSPDDAWETNKELTLKIQNKLPTNWAGSASNREITLELYKQLRSGDAKSACDAIASALLHGHARAGNVWDAIRLAGADLLFRYRTGGSTIGGALIHVVTSASAVRFGFDHQEDSEVRLSNLLQSAACTCEAFVGQALKDGEIRNMNLLNDLHKHPDSTATLSDVFQLLPKKGSYHDQKDPSERHKSDRACQMVFGLMSEPQNQTGFMQHARTWLCQKATDDPHDFKYPIAAFEEVQNASPEWRPYLLASTVHALHGPSSDDAKVLQDAKRLLG